MEDDVRSQSSTAFQPVQMRMSGQHQYPHSHHGTPATEYTGFVWPSPQVAVSGENFAHTATQRPTHQSLHPLVMPQWPSMLSSQSTQPAPNYYPAVLPHNPLAAMSSTPIGTPISTSSTRSGSGSTPRRTLTDDERRQMCEFHEQNPTAKQNEIGSMFGVERSTVSKVLRQKEKYLQKQNEVIRSPERRIKGRSPDIEKTLSNWVIKEQKKGTVLSDDAIRDKAQYFSSVSGPDSSAPNPANNPVWLKNFKRRHNISGRRSSKDTLSPNSLRSTSKTDSSRKSPERLSPLLSKEEEQQDEESPSPTSLRGIRSDESLKVETPEGFGDLTTTLSENSLSAVFTEGSTSSFSPNPLLSPSSPLFTPDSATLASDSFHRNGMSNSAFHRQRSQTFPMLYQDMSTPENSTDHPRFLSPSALDASVEDMDHSLKDIDEAMGDSPSAAADVDMEMATMNPAQMMHPPPLPASLMTARTSLQPETPPSACPVELRLKATLTTGGAMPKEGRTPSLEEARQALKVVWQYFSSRPRGSDESLDMEETAMMGRYMEKLKQRNKNHRGSS